MYPSSNALECHGGQPINRQICLIPRPARIRNLEGTVFLGKNCSISFPPQHAAFRNCAAYLRDHLLDLCPFHSQTVSVRFHLNPKLAREAYDLSIESTGIELTASDEAGLFHAIQSLVQLTRHWDHGDRPCSLPCLHIEDYPAFSYRGMHLDVARHFFPVDFIKRYIDFLARYKFNTFHWHLTDDQGWRIEIKKYPQLHTVGSLRASTLIGHLDDPKQKEDQCPYGGYYTQEEIKEVVAYAQNRQIKIIPEVEMPGHAMAALAAFPQLSCTGKPVQVATKWGIFHDVFAPTKETFSFLEDVLTEVMDLFPGQYIHLGGDECPKDQWKACPDCQKLIQKEHLGNEDGLQSYFMKQMETFLQARGRRMVGWDELLDGGISRNATIMSWRGESGGIKAATMGNDVIMTPVDHCYFDSYQGPPETEPLAIGNRLDLKKVYHYQPIPKVLQTSERKRVLGAQANVWTEYIRSPKEVEYMIFPRMQALAEVLWLNDKRGPYQDFLERIASHLDWLEGEGVTTARHTLL